MYNQLKLKDMKNLRELKTQMGYKLIQFGQWIIDSSQSSSNIIVFTNEDIYIYD